MESHCRWVLQALGGCVGVVIARAAIRDRLDMQASAQAFASMMIVTTIAPIIAPSLGALVLSFSSWHSIFRLFDGRWLGKPVLRTFFL